MDLIHLLYLIAMLAPVGLMLIAVLVMRPGMSGTGTNLMWRRFSVLSVGALLCAGAALALQAGGLAGEAGTGVLLPWLSSSRTGSVLAILVQLLGTVIAAFSARYLQGEPRQQRYIAALAGVLACVHLLLLANHWLVLITAWALVGVALQPLLCFYPDRPFALLAAHKKRIADRMADVLLLVAAVLAWQEVGSGSLTDLWQHLATHDTSIALQISALCLVLAVVLRTALLPVHGWLTQVMEAPTPVSALLHAGVVNLGGYVLIRFAPLLEASLLARIVLVGFGLATALLAGLVMLTRVSIKVRLAWSTVAQMGFMVLQCGLGLYTLAALHLIGHSLYKAHTFLSASTAVRDSKMQMMHLRLTPSVSSLIAAPFLTIVLIVLVQALAGTSWPWWWSGVLALAWAPVLWLPVSGDAQIFGWRAFAGIGMVTGFTALASLVHALPLGVEDSPYHQAGVVALIGMALMYACLGALQVRPQGQSIWRRWSYAGFYVDEIYTRLTLRYWPIRWNPMPIKSDDSARKSTITKTVSR